MVCFIASSTRSQTLVRSDDPRDTEDGNECRPGDLYLTPTLDEVGELEAAEDVDSKVNYSEGNRADEGNENQCTEVDFVDVLLHCDVLAATPEQVKFRKE